MNKSINCILESYKRRKYLEKLSNKKLSKILKKTVWVNTPLFTFNEDLIDEIIKRLEK